MKIIASRSSVLSFLLLCFLAQSIGAADLALMIGPASRPLAVRPGAGIAPRPLAAIPKRATPLPPRTVRLAGALESLARDAQAVYGWLDDYLWEQETARRHKPSPQVFEAAVGDEPPAPQAAAPAPEDRILISRTDMIVGVGQLVEGFAPEVGAPGLPLEVYQERLAGRWIKGDGLRFRINYLGLMGISWGDADGFHAFVPRKGTLHVPCRVPTEYRVQFPLYFTGQEVPYEIEVENTSGRPLRSLRIYALQERFNPAGGRGPALTRPGAPLRIAALDRGGRAVFKNATRLMGPGRGRISFEQTHLIVTESTPIGERTLADAPQAGIVDPPQF